MGRRKLPAKGAEANLPAVTGGEDGAVILSAGRYARSAVMAVFEMIGGVKRMAEWADENPGEYYTKLFSKTITREVETPPKDDSVEALLEAIDTEFEEVTDAEFVDV